MLMGLSSRLPLLAMVVALSFPASSQSVPSAHGGGLPLTVGVGLSSYSIDWGPGRRMEGITAWADWNLTDAPSLLRGFSIEAEGRDLNFGRPTGLLRHRLDTFEGGPVYTWRHFHSVRPYAKYLIGIGSIDFDPYELNPAYSHDTRNVYAPGLGAQFRTTRDFWLRVDYEYQFWPKLFGTNSSNPNGITASVSYNFRALRRK